MPFRHAFRPIARTGHAFRFSAWLACFGLVFQAVLPLLLAAPASAAWPSSPFEGELAICSAHGLADAPADNGAGTNESLPAPAKCPLCQVWHSVGSALPSSPVAVLGPAHETPHTAPRREDAPRHSYHQPLSARAPPLTA